MGSVSPTVCDVALRIGENTQVDVQLPARLPVGAVLLNAQRWLQTYLEEAGSPDSLPDAATGWRLRTPIGTLLDNDRSLSEQHVLSGDALELIAAPRGEEFRPRVENVSVAVARSSARLFAAATRGVLRRTLTGWCAVMIGAAWACVLVLAYTRPSWVHTAAAVAPVAVLIGAAVANARLSLSVRVADAALVGLLLFAPPALALLVPPPWDGAGPRVLVGAVTVLAVSLIGLATDRYSTAWTALATVAGFTAVAQSPALTSARPGAGMLAVLIWGLVILLSRVDLTAVRAARLPIPAFPSGTNAYLGRSVGGPAGGVLVPVGVPPDPQILLTQTLKANRVQTGLLAGLGAVGTALSALLVGVDPQSWAWTVLAAGIPVIFAFRTWHFAGRANVLVLLAATFGSALALAGALAAARGLWWGAGVSTVVAVLALLAPLAVPGRGAPQSPLTRGVRVIVENLVCLAVLLLPLLLLRVPQMVYNRDFG